MDLIKIGKQINLMRKKAGLTQEKLAEILEVSPQAVSKWENGHCLPDSMLLLPLAKALSCSVNDILSPNALVILKAVFTDGFAEHDATGILNRQVEGGQINFYISGETLSVKKNNKIWFLTITFTADGETYHTYCKNESYLNISQKDKGFPITEKANIIDAYYGIGSQNYCVMNKIQHYDFFKWKEYRADYHHFPSNPGIDENEYLVLLYTNQNGINVIACEENEVILYSSDGKNLVRNNAREQNYLEDFPMLKFGNKMNCTWAGALTESLNYMGEGTSYENVMGVSGACYRLAFSYPVWDYSSADGLVAYDYSDPAYKAFGYKAEGVGQIEKDKRLDERRKIINCIDNDIPVLAINLRVAPEWGVITGYKNKGAHLLCRTYFDENTFNGKDFDDETKLQELMLEMEKTEGYLYVDNWPFIISYFGEKTDRPTAKENLFKSLETFIGCASMEKSESNKNYFMGYRAYDVWAQSLIEDIDLNYMKKDDFARYQSINHFCMSALVDARRSAFEYLKSCKELLDADSRQKIIEMSEIFGEIYIKTNDVLDGLSDGYTDTAKPWTMASRKNQAKVLLEAKALEMKAETLAREILSSEKQPEQ